MMTPQTLTAGDTVALVAPARAVTPEEVAAFSQWCNEKGLVLKTGRHLFGRHHQFSGTAAERAADFEDAWTDPDVKAVFCARGGYGSVQVLDLLSHLDWMAHPRWLVGFSDITTLHLHLNNLGLTTLHAPMAIHWGIKNEYWQENLAAVESALFKSKVEIDLSNYLSDYFLPFDGLLMGGNLSLLYAALGTPEQPDLNGKVLFIEDLDEYLYHIDRMMMGLKRAGLLSGLSGMVVGGLSDMKDNATPFGQSAEEIIRTHTAGYSYPVIFQFPAGHVPKNICLKLGGHCTFDGRFFRQ